MRNLERLPELEHGRIDIWFAKIDWLPLDVEKLEAVLSTTELSRARRFRFMNDRNRYVVQQGVLRKLLAGYTGCESRQVDIRNNTNGKPYLAGQKNDAPIQYSVSHSDTFVMYAFSLIDSIGVDIEKIRELPDMVDIVEQHFTRGEKYEFLSCPEDQRLMLFYRFWTRKEAVLKAQGDGLLKALDSVDVAVGRGPGPWRVKVTGKPVVEEYSLMDIDSPLCFAAAGAVAGPIVEISVRHYEIKEI